MGKQRLPEIRPGDFYEDCRYHPMLCLGVEWDNKKRTDATLHGISLITGEEGDCSLAHCGVVPLTLQEAVTRLTLWPQWIVAYDEVINLREQRIADRT